jgi:hypothetical protein
MRGRDEARDPDCVAAEARELRTSFVERARGVDAPAVLWQLAPGRVSWARVFAAIAPDDGRRYAGMVLTTAEAEGATVEELLEALEVPEAAPWSEAEDAAGDAGDAAAMRDVGRGAGVSAMDVSRRRARVRRWSARDAATAGTIDAASAAEIGGDGRVPEVEIAAIARALLAGGDAGFAEPDRAELPRLVASVERWMPADAKGRTRAGAWRLGSASPAMDRVAGLVAAAWHDPGSRAAQAWTLLCELAAAKERTVDEIAGELGAADQPVAVLTDAERAALGEARDFAATLHAWGRGRLDAVASASTLASRLADAVALRVLARLVEGRDPRAPITEARWHALLPASRRSMLLDAVARRAASLRALVEVSHA